MTDYGEIAQRHWAQWLPRRYSQIPNPDEFFSNLGRQVSTEIEELTLELEGQDQQQGESYLQRVGRLTNARMRAQEMILPERVLLAPEPDADQDPEQTLEPRTSPPAPGSPNNELPLVVSPDDPHWREIVDEEDRAQETLRRGRSDP